MKTLKFWLNTGKGRIFIQELAGENEYGQWQDSDYIYLKNIMVEKKYVEGEIEVEEEDLQGEMGRSFSWPSGETNGV